MLRNEYSLTEKVYQNLRTDILAAKFGHGEDRAE